MLVVSICISVFILSLILYFDKPCLIIDFIISSIRIRLCSVGFYFDSTRRTLILWTLAIKLCRTTSGRPHVWSFVMFVLTPADGLCCVWFIYPILHWLQCLEMRTSSVVWAQLSRLLFEHRDGPISETLG
jgi:hypothetical protein